MDSAFLRRASTTCAQLIGNILKVLFYLDLRLRSKKRYTIPAVAVPVFRSRHHKRIPRIVWQTNYTDRVTLSVYANYLFNRAMAPTYEFRLCRDEDCDKFIRENFPGAYQAYSSLQIGAAKADLWRVLVLATHGGIYMDIDAALSWPPEAFLQNSQTELFIRAKDGKLTNYFLACIPDHPTFRAISDKILENIAANTADSIYDMTGPTVVNEIVASASVTIEAHELVCRQGQFTGKLFQYPDGTGYWADEQARGPIISN